MVTYLAGIRRHWRGSRLVQERPPHVTQLIRQAIRHGPATTDIDVSRLPWHPAADMYCASCSAGLSATDLCCAGAPVAPLSLLPSRLPSSEIASPAAVPAELLVRPRRTPRPLTPALRRLRTSAMTLSPAGKSDAVEPARSCRPGRLLIGHCFAAFQCRLIAQVLCMHSSLFDLKDAVYGASLARVPRTRRGATGEFSAVSVVCVCRSPRMMRVRSELNRPPPAAPPPPAPPPPSPLPNRARSPAANLDVRLSVTGASCVGLPLLGSRRIESMSRRLFRARPPPPVTSSPS